MHRCEPLDWNRELLPGADLFDPAPVKGTTCTSTLQQYVTDTIDSDHWDACNLMMTVMGYRWFSTEDAFDCTCWGEVEQ